MKICSKQRKFFLIIKFTDTLFQRVILQIFNVDKSFVKYEMTKIECLDVRGKKNVEKYAQRKNIHGVISHQHKIGNDDQRSRYRMAGGSVHA